MEVYKTAVVNSDANALEADDLELLEFLGKSDLKREDIYVFRLLLCDNEVDRDFERFDHEALVRLGELFIGKPGIFDHNWSAHEQVARIYKTQVCAVPGVSNADGQPYEGLFARAYMLRGGENDELIRSIEAGIRREVSVSCAVSEKICSICGESYDTCVHQKGAEYGGRICHAVLTEPTDAYEWSFVAVPAQRAAGVVKKYGGEKMDIRKYLESSGSQELISRLDELEKQAELGKSYMDKLRAEVVRLGALADCGIEPTTLRSMADKLDEAELLGMKKAYEQKVKDLFPTAAQLTGKAVVRTAAENAEYRI